MAFEVVGYAWLAKHFALPAHRLRAFSVVGRGHAPVPGAYDREPARFTANYWPGESPLDHLMFALRYEPIALDLLADIFKRLDPAELALHISSTPTGRYARVAGFLYEWFTGLTLAIKVNIGGNYAPVLDQKKMLTPAGQREPRWRVFNNLPGTPDFCPLIRRTVELESYLNVDFSARIASYRKTIDPRLFSRAISYLYEKETQSSFEIEREPLSPGRANLFLKALAAAGQDAAILSEAGLTALQLAILDSRLVQTGFRTSQNYVGSRLPRYRPKVDYVCPPPQYLPSLMRGLMALPGKLKDIEPLAEAAMISFGFVFIHPFEDGNGRIHRFLIHDVLARREVLPRDFIIPVSAYMNHHRGQYDAALEQFSKPLLRLVRFDLDEARDKMQVENPLEVESSYRYPDLTAQAEFLGRALRSSIEEDLLEEIDFLQKYDRARSLIRGVVDLPDKRLDLLIRLMHDQQGRLSLSKRTAKFPELTGEEILAVQEAFAEGFQTTPDLFGSDETSQA